MFENLPSLLSIEQAENHGVLGLMADSLLRSKSCSAQRMAYVLQFTGHIAQTHHQIRDVLADITQRYEDEGLHPILLKGEHLASFYDNPLTRSCGDIDLIFCAEEADRACLLAEHWTRTNGGVIVPAGTVEERMRHLHVIYHGVNIEIHYPLWESANTLHTQQFIKLSNTYLHPDNCEWFDFGYGKILVPTLQYNLIYMTDHMCHHLLKEGISLRQICDLAAALHRGYQIIDQARLRKELQECGLLRAWQILGGIIVKQLGLPSREFPFYNEHRAQLSQGKLLQSILKGGNFGRYGGEGRDYRLLPHGWPRRQAAIRWIFHFTAHNFVLFPYDSIRYFVSFIYRGVKS